MTNDRTTAGAGVVSRQLAAKMRARANAFRFTPVSSPACKGEPASDLIRGRLANCGREAGGARFLRRERVDPLPIPPPQVGEGDACGSPVPGRTTTLPRIDFDIDERCFLVRAVAGPMRVHVNRKSSGRISGERHLGSGARRDTLLDVVAVQVQDERLIARPSQCYDVALLDPDQPHVFRDAAALALEIEAQLRGHG